LAQPHHRSNAEYVVVKLLVINHATTEGRSSTAVRVWMPMATVAAAITFVIAFVMRIPQQQTIAAASLAAIIVF
jgi:hypothetical protein